jgi:hypothetical protein
VSSNRKISSTFEPSWIGGMLYVDFPDFSRHIFLNGISSFNNFLRKNMKLHDIQSDYINMIMFGKLPTLVALSPRSALLSKLLFSSYLCTYVHTQCKVDVVQFWSLSFSSKH